MGESSDRFVRGNRISNLSDELEEIAGVPSNLMALAALGDLAGLLGQKGDGEVAGMPRFSGPLSQRFRA